MGKNNKVKNPKADEKHRHWCFTSYEIDIKPDLKLINYIVYGLEICPSSGREHQQGYVEFSQAVTMENAQKKIGNPTCSVFLRQGTQEQASGYCKKGEQPHEEWSAMRTAGPNYGLNAKVTEHGTLSNPGERTDLEDIRDMILQGKSHTEEMLYSGLIQNYQQIKFAETVTKYRKQEWRDAPYVEWIWGEAGLGKTRPIWALEGLELYSVEPRCQWFDGYHGQHAVLFDDLNHQMDFKTLLRILDRYPMRLQTKGSFTQWCPKRIYITSDLPPEDCFPFERDNNKIDQLLRRISLIKKYEKATEVS